MCNPLCVGLGPNVDFFTPTELETIAKTFKEEHANGAFDEDGEESKFFEKNFSNLESAGSGGSLAGGSKKMTMRRPTKKVDGTQLGRTKNVSCLV